MRDVPWLSNSSVLCLGSSWQMPLPQGEPVKQPGAGPEVARWVQAWREPVFRPLTSGRCVATPSGAAGGRGGSVRVGAPNTLQGAIVTPVSTGKEAETQRA